MKYTLVEKLSFMTISYQHGHVIPNIHVTLDISYHFGQCHKRPCFLLVTRINDAIDHIVSGSLVVNRKLQRLEPPHPGLRISWAILKICWFALILTTLKITITVIV